jgi:hypothetical protein
MTRRFSALLRPYLEVLATEYRRTRRLAGVPRGSIVTPWP